MSSMPPEWSPHAATWMGFPNAAYRGTGVSTEQVQDAWATIANAIADHEAVKMLCHPTSLRSARKRLSARVDIIECPLNDAWLRDSGPTFVVDDEQLVGIDWRFNGWGDNTEFDWQADNDIAGFVCQHLGCERRPSALTNEGGGLHVGHQGQVLLTRTVQLDPARNPDWTDEAVETEIHSQLGTEQAIWLDRGLYRDYEANGTNGHVDMVACFTPSGPVLLHWQQHEQHPDHQQCTAIHAQLRDAGIDVLPLNAPTTVRDNIDWVDYSYINHYVVNDAVIVPAFNDPNDGLAMDMLREVYPQREVRSFDARVIFAMGGGVHCITQQQPLL